MAKRMYFGGILLLLALAGPTLAQPTITGTWNIAHMDTATVSGFSFGFKSPAAPYMWDLFDDGDIGATIDSSGSPSWDLNSTIPGYAPRYSEDHSRSPGSLAAWHEFSDNNYNSTLALYDVPSADWYISGWYYDDSYMAPTRNEKVLSYRGDSLGSADVNPQFRYGYDSDESGHTYIMDCSGTTLTNNWSEPTKHQDKWRRLEAFFGAGSSGLGLGLVQVWDDLEKTVEFSDVSVGACDISHLYFHHYYTSKDTDGNTAAQNWYWDELYVDNTRARIEAGNASTWDACTQREIQIPVVWTDTQLRFIGNQGSLGTQQVYLYVVDEYGAMNQEGFPFVFGGGDPDSGPPGQTGTPYVFNP